LLLLLLFYFLIFFDREKSQCGDELGNQVKHFLDSKELVPDELFIALLKERMTQPDAHHHGVLLDGFPRNASQVHFLLKDTVVAGYLVFNVEEKTLKARAKDRRMDPVTGDIYNLTFLPPQDPEITARLVAR
jgi:adenylate kinase